MSKSRIRFAPSPTGSPTIGSLWQVLFEWLLCRHEKGEFILRIEDTDRARFVETAENEIYEALDWLGLNVDESPRDGGDFGPYRQSERLAIYREYADKLLREKFAYVCFCTPERLTTLREEQQANKLPTGYDRHCLTLDAEDIEKRMYRGESFVVRLKMPNTGSVFFNDLIRGRVEFLYEVIDDQVLVKSDGWPTYHLANVVDDHLMQITTVIRGEEWLSSTPKHLYLYECFGWQPPSYAHLPLILGANRAKLSKRHGDTKVKDFIAAGYLPEAMMNFLALLGWSPKSNQEFFTRAELINEFSLSGINKSGAIFNREKLDWFNAYYLKQKSIDQLWEEASKLGFIDNLTDADKKILAIFHDRLVTLAEIPTLIQSVKTLPDYAVDILVWKKSDRATATQRLQKMSEIIKSMPKLNSVPEIENYLKQIIDEQNLGNGETLWPLRVALSGAEKSPTPFDLIWALGTDEAMRRINIALNKLS